MKNYKNILLLIFVIILSLPIFAQRDVLNENVDDYTVFQKQKFGANGKYFAYNYFQLGFYTPAITGNQYDINYGQSFIISYGYKFKLKIFRFLAIGSDLSYSIHNYNLDKNFIFLFDQNQKEKLTVSTFGTELFFRLNFGKTGNSLGKYLDLGAYGAYNFSNNYIIKIHHSNPTFMQAKNERFEYKNIDLIEKIQYGAICRIGINKFSLLFKYRFSDLLKDNIFSIYMNMVPYNDMPKFSAGFEYSLY